MQQQADDQPTNGSGFTNQSLAAWWIGAAL
jgi:hypothetical protein